MKPFAVKLHGAGVRKMGEPKAEGNECVGGLRRFRFKEARCEERKRDENHSDVTGEHSRDTYAFSVVHELEGAGDIRAVVFLFKETNTEGTKGLDLLLFCVIVRVIWVAVAGNHSRGNVHVALWPASLNEAGHHDNEAGILLPNHLPKVLGRVRQRALRADEAHAAVTRDVVGVDVVNVVVVRGRGDLDTRLGVWQNVPVAVVGLVLGLEHWLEPVSIWPRKLRMLQSKLVLILKLLPELLQTPEDFRQGKLTLLLFAL